MTSTTTPCLIPSPDRSKRVKDAKTEAQKEIEDYRKQKDDEFKEFEKKVRTIPLLQAPTIHFQITDYHEYSKPVAIRKPRKMLVRMQMSS